MVGAPSTHRGAMNSTSPGPGLRADPHTAVLGIAARQYGLLTWEQAMNTGLAWSDIRRFLRAGKWGHPLPRVYSVRALLGFDDPEQHLRTKVMAAQLALGPRSFAGAETAAHLWRMQGLPRWDGETVHMVLPALGAQRHIRGIVLHTWDTLPDEVTDLDGVLRLTTPGRTLRDTLLRVGRDTAVCLMDSVLSQGLVDEEEFEHLETANRGRRGCVRVRPWWFLADGRSQSPLETRVRLICADGGLPPTELQRPFHDGSGRLIGVVDFWWENLRVIGEADGIGPHSLPAVLARDRSRQNDLQVWHPGTRLVRFTWQDLKRPQYILATLIKAGAGRTP